VTRIILVTMRDTVALERKSTRSIGKLQNNVNINVNHKFLAWIKQPKLLQTRGTEI